MSIKRGATSSVETRTEAGAELVRIPTSQLAVRSPTLNHFADDGFDPNRTRIRTLVDDAALHGDELVAMAMMIRASDGGPLRTFSGNLAHENGRIPARKADRLLHWQGVAQRALVIRSECDFEVARIATESVALEMPGDDGLERHTLDVETIGPDGAIRLWEVKRDERDLDDPSLRPKLARTAEVCRRCGIAFGVIYRDEIFQGRIHRQNAELFASRAFTSVTRRHLHRLEAHAYANDCRSTYGALAEALEPISALQGRALLQALAIQRRVEIDLTRRLRDDTPLIIH